MRTFFGIHKPNIDRLEQRGDVKALINALRSQEKLSNVPSSKGVLEIRREAIKALGRMKDETAIEPLVEILKHGDRFVTYYQDIAKTLVNIGHPNASELLIRHLETLLRENASFHDFVPTIYVLGELKNPRALSILEGMLHIDKPPYRGLRDKINYALGKRGDQRPTDELIREFREGSWNVQKAVGVTLGTRRDTKAIEPLIEMFRTKDGSWNPTQEIIEDILYRIGESAVQPLVQSLDNKDIMIRVCAAATLEKMKWEPSDEAQKAKYLIALNYHRGFPTEELVKIGEYAVAPLIHLLNDNYFHVRLRVVSILGKIGDRRAIGSLIKVLNEDENGGVCDEAAQALRELGWQPSTELERINYLIWTNDWESLICIGKPAVETLINILKRIREACYIFTGVVKTLGKIGGPEAFEALIESLDDYRVVGTWTVSNDFYGDTYLYEIARDTLIEIGKKAVKSLTHSLTQLNPKDKKEKEKYYRIHEILDKIKKSEKG